MSCRDYKRATFASEVELVEFYKRTRGIVAAATDIQTDLWKQPRRLFALNYGGTNEQSDPRGVSQTSARKKALQ
jgi:hypothetical protein